MFKIIKVFLFLTILAFSSQVQAKKYVSAKNNKTNFTFVGCANEEASFNEITVLMESSQAVWNKHKLDELINFYAPNFQSKDGITIEKIRTNLTDFWQQYSDAQISSLPGTIYVCGDYATVNLTEITTATGLAEDSKVFSEPPKFKAWIHGITTLKKVGNDWKIVSEEVLSEEMWKYYGSFSEKLLEEGKVKLILPSPVKDGENYIAELKYTLPEKVQAVALLDKILLTEFAESKTDKTDKLDKAKKKEKEIESARRTIEGTSEEGLRRLFTANSLGQDELVRAQIELISFTNNKGPALVGIIGISERIVPKRSPKPDETNTKTLIKSFKEQSLNLEKENTETSNKPKG